MSKMPYPTDLTDRQWRRLKPWIPPDATTGRPSKCPKREILIAILCVTRSGGTWRALPHDFPPYRIVFHWFRKWQADGTWRRVHDKLRERVRKQAGRTPKPSAAVLDSQTTKTTEQVALGAASLVACQTRLQATATGEKGLRPQAAHGGGYAGLGLDAVHHAGQRARS